MARYKRYDYRQTVLVPVLLDTQLLPGTLEYALQVLVEHRRDTRIFGSRYKNEETGCPAYDPKILLKVILLAYARGIISSRKIDPLAAREIYGQGLAMVEPVFGNLRSQKRLDRFPLRGKVKVSIQWLLYGMVHNMEKILHYGRAVEKWSWGARQTA